MTETPMNTEDTQPEPKRNWLRRNWKLALSIWLATCISGAIVAFVIAFIVTSSSEVTSNAFRMAERNRLLTERLGSPLHKGWFVLGNIETTPTSGRAELAIPVSGPKGSGTLYVEAHKQAGLWKVDSLQLGIKDSEERTDLLLTARDASPAP
jgi:hypothetical protein